MALARGDRKASLEPSFLQDKQHEPRQASQGAQLPLSLKVIARRLFLLALCGQRHGEMLLLNANIECACQKSVERREGSLCFRDLNEGLSFQPCFSTTSVQHFDRCGIWQVRRMPAYREAFISKNQKRKGERM